ncbi:hypothetical protein R6Q57_010735 [Mikania cordata]
MARDLRPPGFRFYPTEEELVSFYLPYKLEGQRNDLHHVIPVVNVYEHEPWQLPEKAGELCSGETEQWFFYVPKQEKDLLGGKSSRTTTCGYWKATGSPAYVYSSTSKVIGVKKTMVFYQGKSSKGRKTKWKMNEYQTISKELDATNAFSIPKLRNELRLCRVYIVSGRVRAFDRRPFG